MFIKKKILKEYIAKKVSHSLSEPLFESVTYFPTFSVDAHVCRLSMGHTHTHTHFNLLLHELRKDFTKWLCIHRNTLGIDVVKISWDLETRDFRDVFHLFLKFMGIYTPHTNSRRFYHHLVKWHPLTIWL